jgi:hypothetical protein
LFRTRFGLSAEDYLRERWQRQKRVSNQGQYVFIASMPKTASTFLASALETLLGYRRVWLADGYERNDQNLYLPRLIDTYSFDTVTHQHLRATGPNIMLLKQFSIQPVVLVRNIFDVAMSIHDHMFKEDYAFPTFYCDEHFRELSLSRRLDQIVELAIPWYFNFYVGWWTAAEDKNLDILWLTYEDLIADWGGGLVKVADFYGTRKSAGEAETALDLTKQQSYKVTRLNKGIAGRGKAALTDEQIARIRGMARFYPWVDFRPIGIE